MTIRAAGTALLGVLAIGTGLILHWVELIAVGLGLLAIPLLTLFLRRPAAVTWRDESSPVRVTRGDAAAVVVSVDVASGPVTWVSAVSEISTDRVFLPPSAGGNSAVPLSWPIDTSRRGEFFVGPSRLEFGDPFGLRRHVLATREQSPVLVVPRVHALDSESMAAAALTGTSGERLGSDSFESLREYAPGDPIKRIHWPTSARVGTLMVKRMVDTTVPWLLVVLDVNARAYDRAGALFEDFDADAFEESVDTAASWAWHGCNAQQRVLLTTTSTSPGQKVLAAEVTARSRESALDALATVEAQEPNLCGPGRVSALCRRQGVGRVILITGRHTAASSPWASTWRRHLPVTVVVGHA